MCNTKHTQKCACTNLSETGNIKQAGS